MRYRNLSGYLRDSYGRRAKKICIDGGFSCPNRDGTCGYGGCIYCGERGAGEHIDPKKSIGEQVHCQLERGGADDIFIAYFQNFTNTYADVATLKERYDAALIDERIKILSIGTRPDCINEEIAVLLDEYKKTHEVWVELGLQTANDKTADKINRGYHLDTFERAMRILNAHDIKVVLHLIVGLPGEDLSDVAETARYVSDLKIFGVKIHSLYVMEGTALADMYLRGEYSPLTLEEYVDGAVHIIGMLAPDVTIHRLTGDCPDGLLLAPTWSKDKMNVIDRIANRLEESGIDQGSLIKRTNDPKH